MSLTTCIQIVGKEEDIVVEMKGFKEELGELPEVPLEGRWQLTLSTILQDQPWVLVCTSRTPLRIQSISTSDVSRKHGEIHTGPRAPGKSGTVSNFPNSFDPIIVDRVRPKR